MHNSDLIDASDYSEYINVVSKAKQAGIECVLVFKPNIQTDRGGSESPDLVVCTSNDPKVIAALLGNYHVGGEAENEFFDKMAEHGDDD